MSVIRVKHQENYVVISKVALEDPVLSFKAKGLWAYCMSRHNTWEFHVSHLATISKDGVDAIYSAIKELEEAGYVRKIQKNEKGKFGSVDYEVSEIKIILPLRDFPQTEVPQTENPPLTSNDCLSNIEKEVVCIPSPGAPEIENPSVIKKIHPNGSSIQISLPDIFTRAVVEKKSWTTEEINQCWKILSEYKGYVRDAMAFFEGTIKNLRNKVKSEYLNKNKAKESCQSQKKPESETCKPTMSEKDMQEPRSLMSMMQEAGIW